MTNALTEQSEWTLTYDYGESQLQWDTNHELWAAWAMLEGVFRGMNVAGTDIPMYVRRNYENRVCVRCNSSGLTIYEGMLGSLARIALDEVRDEELQNEIEKRRTRRPGTQVEAPNSLEATRSLYLHSITESTNGGHKWTFIKCDWSKWVRLHGSGPNSLSPDSTTKP